jgi:hypothetical protein
MAGTQKPDTIKAHIWVNYCGGANNSHTGHTLQIVYIWISAILELTEFPFSR